MESFLFNSVSHFRIQGTCPKPVKRFSSFCPLESLSFPATSSFHQCFLEDVRLLSGTANSETRLIRNEKSLILDSSSPMLRPDQSVASPPPTLREFANLLLSSFQLESLQFGDFVSKLRVAFPSQRQRGCSYDQ